MHETIAEAARLHDQARNGTSHGHRIHFRNHWWNEATGEQEASQSLEICLGSNLNNTTLQRCSTKEWEKNPKTWDHVILPPFEFGASFCWTVSAYKKTCRTSPKLHTILLKSQHPRSHLFHLAAEPKEHQDWHPSTSLPPTDITAVSACIRWRQVSPVIHAMPCQVSSMYDVTSTCLNMFA